MIVPTSRRCQGNRLQSIHSEFYHRNTETSIRRDRDLQIPEACICLKTLRLPLPARQLFRTMHLGPATNAASAGLESTLAPFCCQAHLMSFVKLMRTGAHPPLRTPLFEAPAVARQSIDHPSTTTVHSQGSCLRQLEAWRRHTNVIAPRPATARRATSARRARGDVLRRCWARSCCARRPRRPACCSRRRRPGRFRPAQPAALH